MVDARRIVSVVAEVRRDEHIVRRARQAFKIARQLIEIHHVGLTARTIIDDRVKVDEGVVLDRVLITRRRIQQHLARIERGVRAARAFARRILAHVLHVALPAEAGGLQLISQRLDHLRVDTARSLSLTVRIERGARQMELAECDAVALGRAIRRLTAQQCHVVRQTVVTDREVVEQHGAPLPKGSREIRRGRARRKRHIA